MRIGAETVKRLLAAGDDFALEVRDPSDLGAAISALKLARVDLLGLAALARSSGTDTSGDAPAVTAVVNAPRGPLLLVENLRADEDMRRSIPEVVQRRLDRAGVDAATIEVPTRGGPLDALDTTRHAVVLRLFPHNHGRAPSLPADWLDIAGEWVTGDLGGDESIRLRVLGVEYEVAAAEVSAVVHECGLAKAWCDAVNGDLSDRIRIASVTFGRLPHLALGAGGPQVDHAGLVARFRLLQEVARELAADVAYGCIDFEPSFDGLALGLSPDGWQTQGGAPPNVVARELIQERVPDAFPYQVLGRGHARHLDTDGLDFEALGDGHIEVTFGEPGEWLPDSIDRDDVQAHGWDALAPLLVMDDDLAAYIEGRDPAMSPHAGKAELDGDESLDSVPDLDGVTLESSAHPRRGTKLTLLELVSWLNHEPHTDSPACVSPVVASYARWLAAGFDTADRQALKALAPRLIGTAPTTPEEERARQWRATEWLVRVQAPAWLRAAGMLEAAERLESLDRLTNDLELVRAVDILGTAITIASRRIDITASIVSDDDREGLVPDEEIVWSAWERVNETTGYVAASEAATFGAPAELTYATDLRVIECGRDPRVRDELDAARQSVGDTVWATALHAVADEAWEQAWRAADRAARELSGFTVRVEMGRVAKTMLDNRSEDADSALERADQAARDSLTRAALAGGAYDDEHPWDAARNAARMSDGGQQWSVVSDETRRAIGEDAWSQAMADARAVVTHILTDVPDTVARVVVAAVAREASSAAARGVALRATAVARAQGGDHSEADAAAHEALQRIAIGLQADSVGLLDRLIEVEVPTPVAP
ncbi:MAG TPA: hypothetical protein VGZ52_01175 [Acidimicrobiales bacterium]|nr:hypothetical protein [Acidimicrobiales bacterium]